MKLKEVMGFKIFWTENALKMNLFLSVKGILKMKLFKIGLHFSLECMGKWIIKVRYQYNLFSHDIQIYLLPTLGLINVLPKDFL